MDHDSDDFVILNGIDGTLLLRRSLIASASREGTTLFVSYRDESTHTLEFDDELDARHAIDAMAYGQ